ncbi:MAG: type IVB secretion system protein IcmH/DotU, partial [Thiohalocapsa sp.]
MTNNDPFSTGDGSGPTVIRPIPGGRRPRPAAPPPPRPAAVGGLGPQSELSGAAAENPLIACASGLLSVAGQLRGSPSHPDPAGLLEGLAAQIRQFETCARARGLVDAVVLPARYVLCALLDESVLDTPWGSESNWGARGLLITFHNESWGGEKFFEALERLLAYPSGNLQLLELMYLCLAFGFEGRYRVREGGRAELEQVRERLYQAIHNQMGEPEPELSPHWQGVHERRDPLLHHVPLWVLAAISGVVLLGLFSTFTFALHRASDPVFAGLAQLGRNIELGVERPQDRLPVVEVEETPPGEAPPTLRELLADEIAAQRLEVVDR